MFAAFRKKGSELGIVHGTSRPKLLLGLVASYTAGLLTGPAA